MSIKIRIQNLYINTIEQYEQTTEIVQKKKISNFLSFRFQDQETKLNLLDFF